MTMRRWKGFLVALFLATISVPNIAEAAPVEPIAQLVSHVPTTGLTDGNISAEEWHECVSELSGRAANSKDVITLPWVLAETEFEGWVNPFIVAQQGTSTSVVDISGIISVKGGMTCSIGTEFGIPWNQSGNFEGLIAIKNSTKVEFCSVLHRLVCVVVLVP